MPARMGIWVGRAHDTSNGHIVIPIWWNGTKHRWQFDDAEVVTQLSVDEEVFPLTRVKSQKSGS